MHRFQFTIRDMLWATFWAALTIAAWMHVGGQWENVFLGRVDIAHHILALCMVAFSIAGSFVTIAAMFRRTWIGVALGGAAVLGAFLFFLIQFLLPS